MTDEWDQMCGGSWEDEHAAKEALRQAEQQMRAARPWDVAEHESLWSITGQRPDGSRFTDCLALTLPGYVTGSDKPLFAMLPPLSSEPSDVIDPAWITRATPLLIVHRDEPGRAYWEQDQEWIRTVTGCQLCGYPLADHEADGQMLHDFVQLDDQCPITNRRCDRPCGTECIRGMFTPDAER